MGLPLDFGAQSDPTRGPRGLPFRHGVPREQRAQTATPSSGDAQGSPSCARRWAPQVPRGQCWGAGRGRSYPVAAELEAAVGRGGCCNPLGAAGLRALWVAGTLSCWKAASEPRGHGHPEQAGQLLAGGAGAAGASSPGAPSGLSRPPGCPPAQEAAAARLERSGAEAKVGAGREPRPLRIPQLRSRRLEPTSAETKMPEDSANNREAEDTSLDVK